ncbi:hypothetical protein EI94DRAFT_1698998 [Lactarius quietus]|nr:hypothetical protein EI94DRAFT_1698998 [Lactarius quietus]
MSRYTNEKASGNLKLLFFITNKKSALDSVAHPRVRPNELSKTALVGAEHLSTDGQVNQNISLEAVTDVCAAQNAWRRVEGAVPGGARNDIAFDVKWGERGLTVVQPRWSHGHPSRTPSQHTNEGICDVLRPTATNYVVRVQEMNNVRRRPWKRLHSAAWRILQVS